VADPDERLVHEIAQAIHPTLIAGRGPAITLTLTVARLARDTALRLGWTPPPTADGTCRHCGRDNHGMACRGMLRAAGLDTNPLGPR
jgi:hypothetical protein